MKLPFSEGKCAKCGDLMIFRPDKIPFCSKCEKRISEEAQAKLGKGEKQVLHSEAVEE